MTTPYVLPAARTYVVRFDEGTEFAGVWFRCKGISVAEYMNANGWDALSAVEMMADRLLEWNLEDENGPLPPTRETVQQLPTDLAGSMAVALISEYLRNYSPKAPRPRTAPAAIDPAEIPMDAPTET